MSVGGGGRYRCIVAKRGKAGEEDIWQNALTLQRRSKRVGSTLTVVGGSVSTVLRRAQAGSRLPMKNIIRKLI